MSADPTRLTLQELTLRAALGLGKVDTLGHRGVTLVTAEEVEAMAGLLAVFGLIPIPPGGAAPPHPFIQVPKEAQDAI